MRKYGCGQTAPLVYTGTSLMELVAYQAPLR